MKSIALLIAGFAFSQATMAQISVTSSSLLYTQDFNSLDTASATSSSNLPNGWSIKENGTSTTTVNNQYKGGDGSSNTGDTYSFGTAGSTERALGSLASGSNRPNFGVKFVNNTGSVITGIAVNYRGEQWRNGPATNGDTLRCYYNTSAAAVVDTFVTGDVAVTSLDLTTINHAAPAGPLNGNTVGNFTAITSVITVSIPVGGTILLKWVDPNAAGSDDGLAIDDVNILFSTGPASPNPNIVLLSPADNATGVNANSNLIITFDKNVTGMAAGSIRIKNVTNQTTVTKVGNSSDVAIVGPIVTISNVGLVAGKSYYVTFDSAAFESAGNKSAGIYDTTQWNFVTGTSGINSIAENNFGLSITGVATTSIINLMYSVETAGTYNISMFDVNGREVYRESFTAATGTQHKSISGLNISNGLYIIRMGNEKNYGIIKAMVQ